MSEFGHPAPVDVKEGFDPDLSNSVRIDSARNELIVARDRLLQAMNRELQLSAEIDRTQNRALLGQLEASRVLIEELTDECIAAFFRYRRAVMNSFL